MIAAVWNNGQHHKSGAGYGLKLKSDDRDRFFKKEWEHVLLTLEGRTAVVAINIDKKSFWGDCMELINIEIGRWLIDNGKASWPKAHPPSVRLEVIKDNNFSVSLPEA